MNNLWIAFTGGVFAFAHCLGMCGGFALHLSAGSARLPALGRQLLWQTGKGFTYVFLGALAGFAGGLVQGIQRHVWIQDWLGYAAGAVMILMGLAVAGLLPMRRKSEAGAGLLAGVFGRFFKTPSAGSALTLGVATGFLPCPIVLGFLAMAAQTQSVVSGMSTMAAMGLGTVWSLLLLGLTGQTISLRLRRWAPAVAGTFLVILGSATILRGTTAFHRMLGCPTVMAGMDMTPASQDAAATSGPSADTQPAAPMKHSCCE